MNHNKLTQILASFAKKSSLLVLAFASFVDLDASQNKKQSKASKTHAKKTQQRTARPVRKKAGSAQVVESDQYSKEVSEQRFDASSPVQASVNIETMPLEDGTGYQEVKTTVEPQPEEGKVVTTVETWTWQDLAKAAAIGAAVVGTGVALGYGYMHPEQVNAGLAAGQDRFAEGYKRAKGYWSGNSEQASAVNNEIVPAAAKDLAAQKRQEVSLNTWNPNPQDYEGASTDDLPFAAKASLMFNQQKKSAAPESAQGVTANNRSNRNTDAASQASLNTWNPNPQDYQNASADDLPFAARASLMFSQQNKSATPEFAQGFSEYNPDFSTIA